MKEILYVQAGPFANYVGAHFWNTQESYFTYEDGQDPFVYHDRSFREGLNNKGEPTFCPRLLLFDRKSSFGALPDALYGDEENSETAEWEGGVVEYRQDPIPKSDYQLHLEEEGAEDATDEKQRPRDDASVRFWSDYNRVYFHPRSIQKLPDLADWESAEGDWNASKQTFERHEMEHELMENECRLFVEECDELQGIQVIADCPSFAGFTDAFLTSFRDEHPKLASIVFPCLSSASNVPVVAEETRQAAKAINDALCLRSLESLSTLNVPIQHPSTWAHGDWQQSLSMDSKNMYHTSAFVSTHIESATLPFRLKSSSYDISTLTGLLSPTGTIRTAHIAGVYPLPSSIQWTLDVERRIFDLSALSHGGARNATGSHYSSVHVSRGLRPSEAAKCDELFSIKVPPPLRYRITLHTSVHGHTSSDLGVYDDSIHAPAYPTPTSFPNIFSSPSDDITPQPAQDPDDRHRGLSMLSTSSTTSKLFASYARLAQECVDRRAEVITQMGLEFDEIKELKDDMWALCDQYAADGGDGLSGEEEELGEDEE